MAETLNLNQDALLATIVDQELRIFALNRHIAELNDAIPAEFAGINRADAVREMAKRLGMVPMGDYRG